MFFFEFEKRKKGVFHVGNRTKSIPENIHTISHVGQERVDPIF
jgi:hypothetical protein